MVDVSKRPLAIALMGPTAAGKTDLAIALAEHYPCELVNVDSAQVYRGMDIGTAKPDAATLLQAPHRLMGFLDPAETYSAARFRSEALAEMQDIIARGRIPLLVGGTMLYFKALLFGIAELPEANADVRAAIEAQARAEGWASVHASLAEVDPESAQRIKPTDSQRLQRALEVYRISGQTMTVWHQQQQIGDHRLAGQFAADLPCDVVQLAIAPQDRQVLHRRIAQRFDAMLAAGLVDEVRALYQRGDLSSELPALRAVGYRQVWEFLAGDLDEATMREHGIIATRQLAKRQLTWLRSWQGLNWILTDASGEGVVGPEQVAAMGPLQAAIYYLGKTAT